MCRSVVAGESAPGPLQALASAVLCAISQGLVAGGAGAGLATLKTIRRPLAVEDQVAGTTTADVEDRGNFLLATHLALELLVEAEDGALTAAVHIAGATAAGLVGQRRPGVEAGQGCRARGSQGVGGFGVAQ